MSGKNVLIVYAHQEPKSMNGSLKNIAVDVLSKMGCSVTVSDLYAMNFNAVTTRNDIAGDLCNPQHFSYGVETMEAYKKGCLCEDILKEQEKITEADLVIFQFPLYWFSFPAIMKGWIDRCFVQGFAFDFPGCYDTGLLKVCSTALHNVENVNVCHKICAYKRLAVSRVHLLLCIDPV
ncbi:hypothetical protein GDO81_011709 [Engystomops pustulosus]|uniref:Flavodoxin-like fold domain-containing protein n=1 Tax=Engystomops pustulosus TaxID=76066 RepID=A0AAV7BG60_ENGPU|nr:hypothetical protein GDO81_011709 [Engystomops pustulosus]